MINWDLPNVHELAVTVPAEAIDVMGHVNNTEYLRFMEKLPGTIPRPWGWAGTCIRSSTGAWWPGTRKWIIWPRLSKVST